MQVPSVGTSVPGCQCVGWTDYLLRNTPPPKSLRSRTLHHLPASLANSSVGIGIVNSMDTNHITLCKSTINE